VKKSAKNAQTANHAKAGLQVKSGLKGGRLASNHGKAGLKVKSGLKGGRLASNHSRVSL
jgi:hypothetical protein